MGPGPRRRGAINYEGCNKRAKLRIDGDVAKSGVLTELWPPGLVALYKDQYKSYVQLAYLLTGSQVAAEDAVQDAFVAVRARWSNIETSPGGYVRTAVTNAAHARLRRQGVEARRMPDPPPPNAPADLVDLRDAVNRLPWPERVAVVLRYWADVPDEETARVLKCRPGTVRSHISRGVARLRKELT